MLLRRAALFALALQGAGCMVIGSSRAIDEAEEVVARLPCAPERPGPCTASNKVVYHSVTARSFLSEARRRAHHSDHAQAERFAIQARKAAEEALRVNEAP